MKKSNSIKALLISSFSLMFLPLVRAEGGHPIDLSGISGWIANTLFGLVTPTTWEELVIVVAIFAIFLFAFEDIIENFTMFSRTTSWVIATALALVGSLTGVVLATAHFLMTLTVLFGTFSIFIALLSAFVAFMLVHLGAGWAGGWLRRRSMMIRASRGADETAASIRGLRGIWNEALRR